MTCHAQERRAEALLRLERTRTGWLARCAHAQQVAPESASAGEGIDQRSGLNTIISEWLSELAALMAGGVVASQRHKLLRWAISAALPLIAQWLARQPGPSPLGAQSDTHPDINVPS